MSGNPITPEVQAAICAAVEQGIERASPSCQCGLSVEAQSEVAHFFGMVKDLGDDSYSRGIERMRSGFKLATKFDNASKRLGQAILISVGLALASTIGWAIRILWMALKDGK